MVDAFKQLRSMILLELYCPPLPVMAKRQESGENAITNTHDMLSVFMITAFKRRDFDENNRRREKQIKIESDYMKCLDKCKTFSQAYSHMTQFSIDYLATFILPGGGFTKDDIQVLPPSYISPRLKEEILSYCNALQILSDGNTTKQDLSNDCVESLFMSCIRCAINKQQQSVVSLPVLVGMSEDISEEGHHPKALESCVEVL
jgi:hypothetical protein